MSTRSDSRCNFCSRPRNEVKRLVAAASDNVHICDRCVANIGTVLSKLNAETLKNTPQERYVKKPREIVESLSRYVISQDDAKREVAIAVYEHYRRRQVVQSGGAIQLDGEQVEIEKSNILMLGPSGSGKTALAKAAAKMLDVPFYVADATRLTQAGYVGDDVESLLQGLMADAGNDIERAQWGIIFIDEIDKLARKSGRNASGYRDVSGEGVQQSLLKLIEGSVVPLPKGRSGPAGGGGAKEMIDTTNILFICAGSFAGIEDIISQRLNKGARVGFGGELRSEYSKTALYAAATVEDIQDFGLIPELVGRLPVVTSTYELTEDEMIEILTGPANSFCKQFQALYMLDGIDLQFDSGALREIARQAKKRSTGARALRSVLKSVLKPYSYEAPNDSDIVAIRITEDAIRNPGTAIVVRRSAAQA